MEAKDEIFGAWGWIFGDIVHRFYNIQGVDTQ